MNIFTNKFFIIGSLVFILLAIPISLYLLRQQQVVKTKAAQTTTVSIDPQTIIIGVNEEFNVDVKVTPNQNEVNSIIFKVTFDQSELALTKISPNSSNFPITLEEPVITATSGRIGLSTGTSIESRVKTATKAATLTFKALKITTKPSVINFDDTVAYILSSATADIETENVFKSSTPGSVTITASSTLSPTPAPTQSPLLSPVVSQPPVCTALNVDRTTTGNVPFSITFTVNGNDPDGIIEKITIDFGDGPTQDITVGSGIGTNTVSAPISHTYNNAGSYTASATLTDNNKGISAIGRCSQVITVATSTGTSIITSAPVLLPPTSTPTPATVIVSAPTPTLEPAGTIETTLGIIGGVGLLIGIGIFLLVL